MCPLVTRYSAVAIVVWKLICPARYTIMEDIRTKIETLERSILQWGNPAMSMEDIQTRGWWLTSLTECLMAMGVYAIIVLIGLWKLSRQSNNSKPPARDQQIKGVQTVYNLVQVSN